MNAERYALYERAGDCVKRGKCERECPQRLPICGLLEAVSAEFD